jgi:hypothetical protein
MPVATSRASCHAPAPAAAEPAVAGATTADTPKAQNVTFISDALKGLDTNKDGKLTQAEVDAFQTPLAPGQMVQPAIVDGTKQGANAFVAYVNENTHFSPNATQADKNAVFAEAIKASGLTVDSAALAAPAAAAPATTSAAPTAANLDAAPVPDAVKMQAALTTLAGFDKGKDGNYSAQDLASANSVAPVLDGAGKVVSAEANRDARVLKAAANHDFDLDGKGGVSIQEVKAVVAAAEKAGATFAGGAEKAASDLFASMTFAPTNATVAASTAPAVQPQQTVSFNPPATTVAFEPPPPNVPMAQGFVKGGGLNIA